MKKAVILLSGGLDSTTCLAWAKFKGYACYALSFDYDQRHAYEIDAAKRVAAAMNVIEHRVIRLDIGQFGGSALTDVKIAVPDYMPRSDIPITYVPARNTIFLACALGFAETIGACDLVIGANAVDYSNYPDCRADYLRAFETLANLATRAGVEGNPFTIQAPLLTLTKTEIIELGLSLGVDYGLTVSCYQTDSAGRACGRCDSCAFRHEGFVKANVPDPTPYVSLPPTFSNTAV